MFGDEIMMLCWSQTAAMSQIFSRKISRNQSLANKRDLKATSLFIIIIIIFFTDSQLTVNPCLSVDSMHSLEVKGQKKVNTKAKP